MNLRGLVLVALLSPAAAAEQTCSADGCAATPASSTPAAAAQVALLTKRMRHMKLAVEAHEGAVDKNKKDEEDWILVKSGVECNSSDTLVADAKRGFSVADCASAVRGEGGEFFVYGTGSKVGWCYREQTSSESCPEGYEVDEYDFYKLRALPYVLAPEGSNECPVGYSGIDTAAACEAAVRTGLRGISGSPHVWASGYDPKRQTVPSGCYKNLHNKNVHFNSVADTHYVTTTFQTDLQRKICQEAPLRNRQREINEELIRSILHR